ncbi:MAG: tetratricopeptide repeat protein [Proteobacteria bacterium]|nr:tetratricopeptide repeat protein [Pseudomonadota bacterium]
MTEMLAWLTNLRLEQYSELFAENGIDLRALPHLTEQDLKDLGILLGHRRVLLAAIRVLTEIPAAEENSGKEDGSLSELPAEHRQVTIMFADLVAYTKMSSELDAEEVHTVLGHFLGTADRIVVEHGGTVDKHIGDCIMAVFGAPVAHSNDPARAVRAALEIQQAMPSVSKLAGRSLHVHIGIANGQVMASGVGSDAHYTVTGDSVNLASRLTDAATTDETVLSQGVQMAVSPEFELKDKGEIKVKGVADPVHAYTLLGLPEAEGRSERPFVGRQTELQQFTGLIEACSEIKSGQVVYVRGEAGIGKTRLSAKFAEIARKRDYACHRALALDFGVGKEQGVIRTLARSLLSIPSDSAGDQVYQKVAEQAINRGLLAPAQRVHLNALLGIAQSLELRSVYDALDSAGREQGRISVLTTLIEKLSEQQPLLIFVEDIHWAEESVIQFLGALTKGLVDCASVLVMTSRIEGDPLDSSWKQQTASTPLTTIDLRPLRRDDAMALAADFFDASTRFAQKCVDRADGNPLYLEQLLRSAEEFGEDQVPGSVHSIVQARLDSLQAIDKRAIQAASVLGKRFRLDDLRYMLDEGDYSCAGLIERYLVKPEGDAYLFSHALVQEAVYQSLLKSRRAELHRLAARWFEQQEPELCAIHLDRAGDSRASKAYLVAAQARATELHFEPGFVLAGRGIELVEERETECELMLVQAEALRNLGRIEESIRRCREALEIAGAGAQECRAWLGLAKGLRIAEKQKPALAALDSAESVAIDDALTLELSQIHYLRGNLLFMAGDIDGCLAQHEKSLALADESGSTEGKALALGGLGDAYYLRGHMRTARDQFQACLTLCREFGFGQIEVANRNMVGWSRIFLMEYSEAMEDALASIELARKVGHQRAEMIGVDLAGLIELERGNFQQSRAYLERGHALAKSLNASNFVAQAEIFLARLAQAEGNPVEARKQASHALGIVRETGAAFIGPTVLAVYAGLTEDAEKRNAYLREAESILDAGCVSHNYFHFTRNAMELSLKTEDWDALERYARRMEAYTENQPLEWADFMIARGRALAVWNQGKRSADILSKIKCLHEQGKQAGLKLVLAALEDVLSEAPDILED